MNPREYEPPPDAPEAQSTGLIDFERAVVITPMIEPPRPSLVVSGMKPDPAMRVALIPRRYIRQPEYWGIEVVGLPPEPGESEPGEAEPGEAPPEPALLPAYGTVPYQVELLLEGVTGTSGVEVIGANKTEKLDVPT